MKVVFKANCSNDIFKEVYNNFSQKCLDGNSSVKNVRRNFYSVKALFVKNGQVQDFFDRTTQLCEEIEKKGHQKISDLLINELSKLCRLFAIRGNVEKIFCKAIDNCQRNKDGFHELARINDLEDFYRCENRKKDLLRVLARKKNCCKRIIKDYDENLRNFRTIARSPTTIEEIKTQLGRVCIEMADMLTFNRPDDAIALYKKAIEVNSELKLYNAICYAKHRIKDIEKYRHCRKS